MWGPGAGGGLSSPGCPWRGPTPPGWSGGAREGGGLCRAWGLVYMGGLVDGWMVGSLHPGTRAGSRAACGCCPGRRAAGLSAGKARCDAWAAKPCLPGLYSGRSPGGAAPAHSCLPMSGQPACAMENFSPSRNTPALPRPNTLSRRPPSHLSPLHPTGIFPRTDPQRQRLPARLLRGLAAGAGVADLGGAVLHHRPRQQ